MNLGPPDESDSNGKDDLRHKGKGHTNPERPPGMAWDRNGTSIHPIKSALVQKLAPGYVVPVTDPN